MSLKNFKDYNMKFIFNILIITILSASVATAQSKSESAPYSARYQQVKDGITHILRMLEEQKIRIEGLEANGQNTDGIGSMNDELNSNSGKLTELYEKFSVLSIEIAELENANRIKSENVLDRLSELENIVGDLPSPPIGKVILNAGGEAKVFSIGDLGVLASKLPSEADCVEFGLVLEDTFLRDYWSIFVLKPDGEITMCKFLLGNWEIKDSSRREPGHVVVRVD